MSIWTLSSLLILLSIPSFAWARGGGGVRDGGEIVVCPGKASAPEHRQVLDWYLAERHLGENLRLPEASDRLGFRKWIQERLKNTPELADRVLETWDRIGDSETWEVNDAKEDFVKFHKANRGLLMLLTALVDDKLLESMDDWLFDRNLKLPTRTFDALSFDEVPSSCRVNQLATNDGWIAEIADPTVYPSDSLNRRMIELHETLYIVGSLHYAHPHPLLVRSLIESMLDRRNNPRDLKFVSERFTRFEFNRDRFLRSHPNLFPGVGFLSEIQKSKIGPFRHFDDVACPATVVSQYDGMNGIVVYAYYLRSGHEPYRKIIRLSPGKQKNGARTTMTESWPGLGGLRRTALSRTRDHLEELQFFYSDADGIMIYADTSIPFAEPETRLALLRSELWTNWSQMPYRCGFRRPNPSSFEVNPRKWIWLLETYFSIFPSA